MIENEFVDAVSGGLLQSMDIIKYCNDIQSNGIELSSVYVDLLATSLLELPGSVKRQRLCNAMNVIERHFGKDSIKPQSCHTGKPQHDTENASTLKNAPESPRNAPQRKKGGRPKQSCFADNIVKGDKEKVLSVLHDLMKGRQGKDAALIMKACFDLGYILKPNFGMVEKEFGDIGNRSGYNKYLNYLLTVDEINSMKETLKSRFE